MAPMTKSFARTGKTNHIRSQKHQQALANKVQASEYEDLQQDQDTNVTPVEIVDLPSFQLPVQDENDFGIQASGVDPFSDFIFESGQFLTRAGGPILFSAGRPDNVDEQDMDVDEELTRLPEDHDIFGNHTPEAMNTDVHEDRTGIEQDEILFQEFHTAEGSNSETSEWFPYSSRTVSSP